MDKVDFLNLEYILLRAYQLLSGAGSPEWPSWIEVTAQYVVLLGMVISLFFIVLIVYALIRLHQVEHEGFHHLEAAEHEARAHAQSHVDERWERIVALTTSTEHGDWRRAILEADIMLGDVLHAHGYEGESVGEQLKMANPIQLTTLDLAWRAHKMRNDIAHRGEALELTERDVRTTIDYYRRVFEELGAI